ncbi:type II secretion system protein GspJ [Aliidiomarina minuta]|uniref:Type II secretion system protein J n=1 Tax=Aliidiomarina minuta TaxID=880057 RepID=A0A432W8H9_9GAMM|nr:type II secretion system minor pseudopilin GspJ [Aliidiomarina minuta]RUO26430.1 type II secretion system protein GspJ [Aliidiomarina minuta]
MRTRGFTLVELLVAMLIFALIGLASYTVLSQMTDSDARSKERQQALNEVQFAMLMLERDVRQMVRRPVRAVPQEQRDIFVLSDGRTLDSDMDGLAFVRAGWSNPNAQLPRSTLQPVLYRVRDNVLQRIYNTYVDDVSARPYVQDLLHGVEDFRIAYLHDGESINTWNRPGELPQIVVVQITLEEYGYIERLFLTSGKAQLEAATP